MNKWKKAVIHLECATDSEHFYDRMKRIDVLRAELSDGKITEDQFTEAMSGGSRDLRYHGTAIFLEHDGGRYLLTARHVLWNEHSAKRECQEEIQRCNQYPEHMRQSMLESAKDRALNQIFNIIFRVPSFDELLHNNLSTDRAFLMNLGAGVSWMTPYTFSSPDLDIAVISLDHRNGDSRFADELIAKGYEPILSSDIADAPSGEGVEVFTVGFPSSTALLGQVSQHPALTNWSSTYFSLPTYSFGRVSMLHEALPFYWTDMSIYPGNSGGPIIEDDKLVGIVSGQPTIQVENSKDLKIRIPFGKIIKTQFLLDLIQIQVQKGKRDV